MCASCFAFCMFNADVGATLKWSDAFCISETDKDSFYYLVCKKEKLGSSTMGKSENMGYMR